MRRAGVRVAAALPVNPVRMVLARIDLRNHRKIAVIDGCVAYAGSQNITDETFRVRRRPGIGPWIDASVRVEGTAAQALNVVFLRDWQSETDERFERIEEFLPDLPELPEPASTVHVVPSGPGEGPTAIHRALLSTIYAAREELIMTTPYFVPDEATASAISTAAMRGVRVTLVIPKRLDAPLVALAGRSYFGELIASGVRIMLHRDGLLHAKTLTVDRSVGVIGSANFDMRSFWLNFETTLFVYDTDFASQLRWLQTSYMERSEEVDARRWGQRGLAARGAEGVARLLSPLL